jgi:hypothetical protein
MFSFLWVLDPFPASATGFSLLTIAILNWLSTCRLSLDWLMTNQSHISAYGFVLGWCPNLRHISRYWLLLDGSGLVHVWRPHWREDGSVICQSHDWLTNVKVKVKVMLQQTVSQSVCRGVKFTLEPMTRYYVLSESCCVVSVGRPLWREVGSVYCQSLSSVFSP